MMTSVGRAQDRSCSLTPDPAVIEAQQVLASAEPEDEVIQNEGKCIVWMIALFMSSREIVAGTTSTENPVLINCIVSGSCLHFLVEMIGEQYVIPASITIAMAVSVYEVHLGGDMILFISYLITMSIATIIFVYAALFVNGPVKHSESHARVRVIRTLILKQLLDAGAVPVDRNIDPHLVHIRSALFSGSFILSIMALWLQAIGTRVLSPFHRSSNRLSHSVRSSVIPSVLYWCGASLVVAYISVTAIISSVDIPVVVRVACAACTLAIIFKQ